MTVPPLVLVLEVLAVLAAVLIVRYSKTYGRLVNSDPRAQWHRFRCWITLRCELCGAGPPDTHCDPDCPSRVNCCEVCEAAAKGDRS